MSAFNIVRFRVKPDREAEFLEAHRTGDGRFAGLRRAALVKTGERAYCFVAEWKGFGDIVSARPKMIAMLDRFRDCLEDLGGDIGITDPVSGETVVEIKPRVGAVERRRKVKPAKKTARPNAKRSAKATGKKSVKRKTKKKKR